jgi:hypothetical protein
VQLHWPALGTTALAGSCRLPRWGEDAPPSFLFDQRTCRMLLAVHGGLGGSGAQRYPPAEDGSVLTEAYVAARAVRVALEGWFRTADSYSRSAEQAEEALRSEIGDRLAAVRNPLPKSRVGGTLKRELPTTMAAIELHPGVRRRSAASPGRWGR